jgi:hypothetical protein
VAAHRPDVTDEDFIAAWDRCVGSPAAVAEYLGLSRQATHNRRAALVKKGVVLQTVDAIGRNTVHSGPVTEFIRRRPFNVQDGSVVVFSDPHWLPDHSTVAHDALEKIIRRIKPVGVVCGGDAADGDTISRYDPTRGHHKRFTVREEMDCVKEHFDSLDRVIDRWCPKAWRAWTLGNHDVRLSRYVATRAPEIADLPFTRLEDWVPRWPLSWTVEINPGETGMTVVRHRNQAGMLHLQGQKAGCHYVHGHLHRLNVHTLATFAGFRYSVDTGSLADPTSKGFDYAEGGPEHAQGFAVLTFVCGQLLMPELAYVFDGVAYFRGEALVERKAA